MQPNYVVTRRRAKELGLTHYFTGKPCIRNHVAERKVNDCGCVPCVKAYKSENKQRMEKYYESNRDVILYKNRKRYEANKEAHKIRSREWASKNRAKINELNRIKYAKNIEKERARSRTKYRRRKHEIAEYKNSKASYEKYGHKLTVEEAAISDSEGHMKVMCSFCKKYFYPKNVRVRSRIEALSGQVRGENRLYCSDECKQKCPVFGKRVYRKGDEPYIKYDRPLQPELRKMVLDRDSETCQICGAKNNLICHHIKPVAKDAIESADIDNCTTLCNECHNKVHKLPGCSRIELASINKC